MEPFRVPQVMQSWDEIHASHERLRDAMHQRPPGELSIQTLAEIRDSSLFYLAYHGVDVRSLLEDFARFCLQACPELEFSSPHCRVPRTPAGSGRKIRIGFLSKYFFNHTIGTLYSGIITEFDRSRFHVIQLQFPQKADRLIELVRLFGVPSHLEALNWIVTPHPDETVVLPSDVFEARSAIANLELDILFYPDIGMSSMSYFLGFSRLAPVQCTSWGHPITTGLSTIDYFFSSDELEPPGAESCYSEKLIRLGHLPTFYYRPKMSGDRKSRQDFGFDPESHVYVCPQSLFKVHPDFDAILFGILDKDPRAQIVFIETVPGTSVRQEQLVERFRKTIRPHANRICFVPRQSPIGFWRLTELADVLLDTIHFSGGKTSHDALAMGIPIVTHESEFMRGRVTSACYRKIGIADCIARNSDDYIRIALELATDRARREEVREKILQNNGVLFENLAVVREIEEHLIQATNSTGDR